MCLHGCLCGLSLHVGLSVSVVCVSVSVYVPDYMCEYLCTYVWGLRESVVIWLRLCVCTVYMSPVCLYVSMWCRYMQRLHVCLQWVWYVSLGVSLCKCVCGCMNGANMIGRCIWEGTCVWLLGPCVCEVQVCECKHTYGGCLWLCRQAHVCAHIHSSAFLCYSISHPSCPHLCSRTSGR